MSVLSFPRLYFQGLVSTGNGDYLSKAVTAMFRLGTPARQLMQTPIASGSGNYGPDFRLKSG